MQRFYSLDVFRGATVCLMILVNNPGSWSYMYPPLAHAPWHGLTPTDLVFPFFLFAVGNAMAFVLPRLREQGDSAFWRKVIKRTVLIFLIGLFLNWWPFSYWSDGGLAFRHWVNPDNPESGVRILGVLQRIALCYFFAAIIAYYLKPRQAMLTAVVLLAGYWAICYFGNSQDPYSLEGWTGTDIDKDILGVAHMYKGEGRPFDPEGLVSTISAISQVVFGYLAGYYIRQKGKTAEMLNGLFVAGIACAVVGLAWGMAFPINKKIWTSSYTIYTTGLALLTIGTMIYLIEFRNWRGGLARFFDVFGKNALFVFALSAFLPKGLGLIRLDKGVTPWNWIYKNVYVHVFPSDPRFGSLLFALTVILFMWAICYWMDKRKIYVKV